MKKYHGFCQISGNIEQIIKPVAKKKREYFTILKSLEKNWPEIIGKKYHKYCHPKKININKKTNEASLLVVASNSAIAFAIKGNESQILEKISCYFGYKILSKIIISQELISTKIEDKPKEKKIEISDKNISLINESINDVKDSDLREVLQKLGKFVFADSK